jgi:chaperonin GroEL (HSP60 family)
LSIERHGNRPIKKYDLKGLQQINIKVGIMVGELFKGSLGPFGLKKLIVNSHEDIKTTADGNTVIKSIAVANPIAKMMVRAAESLDKKVGDGVKSMLIITGELLKNAEKLLNKGLSPDLIVSGYKKACNEAIHIIDKLAVPVKYQDTRILKNIIATSISSGDIGLSSERIADIAIKAVESLSVGKLNSRHADVTNVLENIQFVKELKNVAETQLLNGVVVDKPVLHKGMPRSVKNAKILLLESPLEIDRKEFYAEIQTKYELIKEFLLQEDRLRDLWVGQIMKSGANVVLCQKGIDLKTQSKLAKYQILGAHWIDKQGMERVAKATGGKIITNIYNVSSRDLGTAEKVEERSINGEKIIFIENCKHPKSVAIIIKANLEKEKCEAERVLKDAICAVVAIYSNNRVVGGGGAIEMELSKRLKFYSRRLSGKEQLAVEAFAKSLEIIPKTLAKNAGLNQTEINLMLKAKHEQIDGYWTGINLFTRRIEDTLKCGIVEPCLTKKRIIGAAVELASMIIRTANIIRTPLKYKTL